MSQPFASSIAAWSRLSPREKLLVGAAAAFTGLLAAIYLGLGPGLEAAASAENRRRLAAADLQDVKRLSAELGQRRERTALAPQIDAAATLDAIASTHGVMVLDAQETNGVRIVRISAPSTSSLVSFAASVADGLSEPAGAISVSRGDGASLSATLTFGGAGS